GFTGDVDLLSGRQVVVRARARGATRVLELPSTRVRAIIQTDANLSEILLRAFILRRLALVERGYGNVVVIGSRHSAGTLAIQEFLTRNSQPYAYLDVDRDVDVQATLDSFGVGVDDVPVVICRGERVLKKPAIEDVADCLGLNRLNQEAVRDRVVIGAGPSGLAAAVYAASEGLDVLVVEANAPGGQAGASSRIENYLGFPAGISGQDLTTRAQAQAQKFGAQLMVASGATRMVCSRKPYRIAVDGGQEIEAWAVILATGAEYRKLALENVTAFEGAGIYYSATAMEAKLCQGEEVIVVGGGNSAGQAAVFLAETTRRVHMLVRSGGLAESMSRYLIRRIEQHPSIDLRLNTEIVSLQGERHLERVTWRNSGTGATEAQDL